MPKIPAGYRLLRVDEYFAHGDFSWCRFHGEDASNDIKKWNVTGCVPNGPKYPIKDYDKTHLFIRKLERPLTPEELESQRIQEGRDFVNRNIPNPTSEEMERFIELFKKNTLHS